VGVVSDGICGELGKTWGMQSFKASNANLSHTDRVSDLRKRNSEIRVTGQ